MQHQIGRAHMSVGLSGEGARNLVEQWDIMGEVNW